MERKEWFALLITLEMGKSPAESRAEFEYGANYLRRFGAEPVRIDGSWKVSEDGTARVLVTRQPVGPCLLITPWNAPLAMPAPGGGSGLQHDRQAGITNTTDHSRPGRNADRGRPARRSAQHRPNHERRRPDRATVTGRPAAQAVLHRVHPRGTVPAGPGSRHRPADFDGTRRERAVHRLP